MIEYLHRAGLGEPLSKTTEPQPSSWVRVEQPRPEEIAQLINDYELDGAIVTDALDPHEVPRIEVVAGNLYFITRLPDTDDEFNDFTTPILVVLHSEHIITVSRDSLARLWEPFIASRGIDPSERVTAFTQMMDAITDNYLKRVATINRQVRALTADITLLRPRSIAGIVEYERKLNDYVDALIPTNVAIKQLLEGRLYPLGEDERGLVEDMSIELEQIITRCKSLLRTITNVRDSFRAVMDTRLNETIRLLTVITVALTIPTMIAGIFGMNVRLPGPVDSPGMFWGILSTSLGASAFFAWYFLPRR